MKWARAWLPRSPAPSPPRWSSWWPLPCCSRLLAEPGCRTRVPASLELSERRLCLTSGVLRVAAGALVWLCGVCCGTAPWGAGPSGQRYYKQVWGGMCRVCLPGSHRLSGATLPSTGPSSTQPPAAELPGRTLVREEGGAEREAGGQEQGPVHNGQQQGFLLRVGPASLPFWELSRNTGLRGQGGSVQAPAVAFAASWDPEGQLWKS